MNPYSVVTQFEEAVAEYTGAPYAVAVESCTSAIFLSLQYLGCNREQVSIPRYTYPGVPCSIIHSGGRVKFRDEDWQGIYQIGDHHHYNVGLWDAALRFRPAMYLEESIMCLSFHIKKLLPIGRGGMILTNEREMAEWLRRARFDGRRPVPLKEDSFDMLGWNCYLQPEQAARGLMLLQALGNKVLPDIPRESQGYPDLSQFKIYQS